MAELANRMDLEADFARKLGRVSSRHRRELIELMGTPPDPGNVPPWFWDKVEKDEKAVLAIMLLLIADESTAIHGARPAQVDTAVQLFADTRASQTATGYVRHTRDRLQQAWVKWEELRRANGRLTRSDVLDDVVKILGPDRDARIAETETSVAQVDGGQIAINYTGIKVARYWAHSVIRPRHHSLAAFEPCPICSELEGRPEDQWGGQLPGHAHPNCDCFIEYIDPDTGKSISFGSSGGPMHPARRDAAGRLLRP